LEFKYKGTKNISDYQLFMQLSYPELTYNYITRMWICQEGNCELLPIQSCWWYEREM